jgi:WXG100 family type VII secretion target
MPAAKVQIQYDEFDGIINRFQQQLDTATNMIKAVRQRVEVLQNGAWIGRGAESFYAECNELTFPALWKLTQALDQAISSARDVAGRFHNAETEAGNLFVRR